MCVCAVFHFIVLRCEGTSLSGESIMDEQVHFSEPSCSEVARQLNINMSVNTFFPHEDLFGIITSDQQSLWGQGLVQVRHHLISRKWFQTVKVTDI